MKNNTTNNSNVRKELNHNWTMLCSDSSVDIDKNNLSIFNIIETLNLEFSPDKDRGSSWYSIPFNLQLVSKFQKPNIDLELAFELKYQIIDPEEKIVGKEFGSTIKFGKGSDNLRLRNRIGTFPVTVGGVYKIRVNVAEVGTSEF